MKLLLFLAVFAGGILFFWEYRQGAFSQQGKSTQPYHRQEKAPLGSVLHVGYKPVADVDYTSLFPPGLDPLANNLLTDPFVIEDFTGELLFPTELPNEIPAPSPPSSLYRRPGQ